MAKKIDLSGMKEFFFNHGEKVALGACGFIAVVLGLWAFLDALSAGKAPGSSDPFAKAFQDRSETIRRQMRDAPMPQVQAVDTKNAVWREVISRHAPTPYAALNEQGDDKRRNPQVLPIKNEPGTIRVDCIAGLTFKHDTGIVRNEQVVYGFFDEGAAPAAVEPPAKKKGGPAVPVPLPSKFVHVPLAKRIVVVQGIFPMKQQVEEFRRALKMNDQGDMFNKDRDDLPRPLGIDVYRHEVPAKGEAAKEPERLMLFDNGQLYVMPALETFLREAIYDEVSPEVLEDWIFAGLTTPMPKLGNRNYPRFTFPGFDVDWTLVDEAEKSQMAAAGAAVGGQAAPQPGKRPGLPGRKNAPLPPPADPQKKDGEKAKARSLTEKELQTVLPSLAGRLWPGKEKNVLTDFNIYHALGNFPSEIEAPKNPPPGGRKGKVQAEGDLYFTAWDKNPPGAAAAVDVKAPKKGAAPPPAAGVPFPAWERDALVRFVDVDVVPGKTYYYSIRVRMANPNFGKKDAVAFQALAANAELPASPWVATPFVKVPEEYHLYAIDQQTHDAWAKDGGPIPKNAVFPPAIVNIINHCAPFQIHQWVEKKNDLHPLADPELFAVGDWIIAGLEWGQYVRRGDYIGKDVIAQVPVWKKDKDAFELPQSPRDPKKAKPPEGIHVNLTEKDGRAPVLVDFTGGKRLTRLNTFEEETAYDALVLMPDGTLKVLNSRDAADVASPDPKERLDAKERQERVLEATQTIRRIKSGGTDTNPKGGMPKVPGAKGGN